MIKLLILIFCLVFIPLSITAQSEKISNRKVKDVIDQMELYAVELIQVKTLKKWKALELSRDMKSQMNYNVVRVKYKTRDTYKTVLIDMHLVPIQYNINKPIVNSKRKKDYVSAPDTSKSLADNNL